MLYYLLDSLKTPFIYADFAKTRVVYCIPPEN
jgi:hypothetical protein